jgi:uncharacterized protein (DUF58 family)
MADSGETFALLPRRRVTWRPAGTMRSSRRGHGLDVVSSRPYRPGDDIRRIDRHASARLSAAWARDEFVVREHYAEENGRAVVAVDPAPTMRLFPPELPWLRKPESCRVAAQLIDASARRSRFTPLVLRAEGRLASPQTAAAIPAIPSLADGLEQLLERAHGRGSHLFVLSDFLEPPSRDLWAGLLARGWDVVPCIVQDPSWEQSFPPVAGHTLPLEHGNVRLTRRDVEARKEANEARLAQLLLQFSELDLDALVLGSHEQETVLATFTAWSERRRFERAAA